MHAYHTSDMHMLQLLSPDFWIGPKEWSEQPLASEAGAWCLQSVNPFNPSSAGEGLSLQQVSQLQDVTRRVRLASVSIIWVMLSHAESCRVMPPWTLVSLQDASLSALPQGGCWDCRHLCWCKGNCDGRVEHTDEVNTASCKGLAPKGYLTIQAFSVRKADLQMEQALEEALPFFLQTAWVPWTDGTCSDTRRRVQNVAKWVTMAQCCKNPELPMDGGWKQRGLMGQ